VSISALDPLNLAGILTPGDKVPRLANNRVLFEGGVADRNAERRRRATTSHAGRGRAMEVRNLLIRKQRPGSYVEPPPGRQ